MSDNNGMIIAVLPESRHWLHRCLYGNHGMTVAVLFVYFLSLVGPSLLCFLKPTVAALSAYTIATA